MRPADRGDLGDVEPGEDAVEHLGVVPALGTQVEQRLALVVQHSPPQLSERGVAGFSLAAASLWL